VGPGAYLFDQSSAACALGAGQPQEELDVTTMTENPQAVSSPADAPRGLSKLRRLLRYTGVNLVTVTLDYAIFLSLTHVYDIPITASIVAYSFALVLNYDLSRRFVFGADGSHKSEQRLAFEFLSTGLLGLVLTAVATGIGVHVFGFKPAWAKTIAVLICFVALYVIRSRLVFTPRVE
jgi:putative flippase GtrA